MMATAALDKLTRRDLLAGCAALAAFAAPMLLPSIIPDFDIESNHDLAWNGFNDNLAYVSPAQARMFLSDLDDIDPVWLVGSPSGSKVEPVIMVPWEMKLTTYTIALGLLGVDN